MVHLTSTTIGVDLEPTSLREQHFCQQCADTYFACTPGMNPMRHLICLSDSYRSKLYDLLETTHPEAFDNTDDVACTRASGLMRNFLKEQLKNEGIELNEDGLEMLWADFCGSHHFYCRVDEYKRKKG